MNGKTINDIEEYVDELKAFVEDIKNSYMNDDINGMECRAYDMRTELISLLSLVNEAEMSVNR